MLALHLLLLGFVVGVTAIADKEAFAWIRGNHEVLDRAQLRSYHHYMWAGLLGLIISGVIMVYPTRIYLLSDLLFDMKMFFVGILLINAVLIGRLMDFAVTMPFRDVPAASKRALFLSGGLSVMSWVSAAGIAFLLFG